MKAQHIAAMLMSIAATSAAMILLSAAGGCASSPSSTGATTSPGNPPSLQASTKPQTPSTAKADTKSELPLSRIEPAPVLAAPASQPSSPAPLEAIQLYAQARAAIIDNQRYSAINFLQRAIKLDPYSFELYDQLGESLELTPNSNAAAMAALEKASALRPDDLTVHYELGRGYLADGQLDKALLHLRLAQLTSEYGDDDQRDTAALVDFFLGRALQQHGYDRAALDQFALLLSRLGSLGNARGNSELAFLVKHPAILHAQIGDLYIKRSQPAEALAAYERAAADDPDNFDLQNRLTRTLELAGRSAQAREHALSLVVSRHADSHSLELFRDICHAQGHDELVSQSLRTLHDSHPDDRALLFALADALRDAGKIGDAQRLLSDAARQSHGDGEIVARLFDLCLSTDDVEGATRLLVTALADRPDSLRELGPLWAQVLQSAHGNRVRLAMLQKLSVPPGAQASRQFWIARMAEIGGRDALAQSALEASARVTPPFAPAYRELIGVYLDRADWDAAQKSAATAALADRAEAKGAKALAAELRGLYAYDQKQYTDAAVHFSRAVDLGSKSDDVVLLQAQALNDSGQQTRATQMLWKLVHEEPHFSQAYSELFSLYIKDGAGDQAAGALKAWIEADP
ncbi:MAG TPA: tetratricopeptide repeat protein, partial [Pirellulales bacterium]|nr:tetratricopeptide repeat protein [Pirellulales bacterium]